MSPAQIAHLLDTDNPSQLEEDLRTIMAKHRNNGSLHNQKQSINAPANTISTEGSVYTIH